MNDFESAQTLFWVVAVMLIITLGSILYVAVPNLIVGFSQLLIFVQ